MNSIISNSACLACPIERAFEMFTVNEKIQSWLCVLANVEPVLNGKYELSCYPLDKENNSTIGCRITS